MRRASLDTKHAIQYCVCGQELYTGSNDCQIIAWAAPRRANEEVEGEDGDNEDTWSD